jgi:hypothetical protein
VVVEVQAQMPLLLLVVAVLEEQVVVVRVLVQEIQDLMLQMEQ